MSAQIMGPVLPLLAAALQHAGACGAQLHAGHALPLADFVQHLERAGAEPGLLWRCGQQLAQGALESLMPAARGVRELGQVLPLAAASMALAQTDSAFELRYAADRVTFEYRVLDPIWPRARDAELTLGFFDGIVRRFAPRDYQPLRVAFEHARDGHAAAIAAQLQRGCLYRQPRNAYSLPRALLGSGLSLTAARELAALQAALAQRERDSDFSQRFRRAVLGLIGSDEPLVQARVAARCAVSTRSLRRRLAAHGCSFRGELQRLRVEYAASALAHTDLPLEEIAHRLGYSEQSALTRAVRRELGTSPSRIRARAASPTR